MYKYMIASTQGPGKGASVHARYMTSNRTHNSTLAALVGGPGVLLALFRVHVAASIGVAAVPAAVVVVRASVVVFIIVRTIIV